MSEPTAHTAEYESEHQRAVSHVLHAHADMLIPHNPFIQKDNESRIHHQTRLPVIEEATLNIPNTISHQHITSLAETKPKKFRPIPESHELEEEKIPPTFHQHERQNNPVIANFYDSDR
ncbi:hypothetical protein KC717_06070 [Candidatus Dojkabacteria bacterium]|uniref:Uncharacterized protein n=1 Tax=Candidatus Dojkabacteria bacterium TaxID=2099670 RepID=A0A955RKV9_9BACT|nr:hypothetical protein [Candidatus Dojkabacteria bacterium]